MSNVLVLDNLGKRYASYANNLHRFANWFGFNFKPASEYWANRNISFELGKGEALALIGQNGAGKSTLLKMITGTVRPTVGTISLNGKISAILELGLGFNPEFTGRENAFHAGGLMGMSQEILTKLMPTIEDFAEIGDFFDKPVRVYSSGMQARLAFALATAERPDLLIVDEVLAVGDSYFQHKSFDRIRQFKEKGTAIILVSHSLGDVRSLCDRVILLDNGEVLKDGQPDEVVDFYNAIIAAKENEKLTVEQRRTKEGWSYTKSGTSEVSIKNIELLDAKTSQEIKVAHVDQELILKVTARVNELVKCLVLGIMIRDRNGHTIWGTNTWHTNQIIEDLSQDQIATFNLHFTSSFGPGSYSISPALTNGSTHLDKNFEWQDNAIIFDIINTDQTFFIGSTKVNHKFTIMLN